MTYQAITQLTNDPGFIARTTACCTEQASTYKDDARPPFVALAEDILRGGGPTATFVRMGAAAPGIAEKADDGSGGVDSTKIADGDILSIVQGGWPVVADLFYPPTTEG